MIAKLGQDGHDRGAKVVATAFADLGFDVDMGPLFQTPRNAPARRSRTTCTRSALVARRRPQDAGAGDHQALKEQGADDIIVFVGGVIPRQDYDVPLRRRREGHLRPGHADPGEREGVLEQIRKGAASE